MSSLCTEEEKITDFVLKGGRLCNCASVSVHKNLSSGANIHTVVKVKKFLRNLWTAHTQILG